MQIRVAAIVVFLVLTGGGLAMHFRQQTVTEHDPDAKPADVSDIPVPPKSGPYGQFVVVGDTVHNFGVMEHMQSGSHEFKVRNDGQAPLKMVALKKDQTCQCTLGSLGQDGLKPGEETVVKLSWTIKNPSTLFEHSAAIRTDDPKNPITTFRVRGLVGKRLAVKPSNEINLGTLSEKDPTERSVFVYSETVDAFKITKFEPTNPKLIIVAATPMTAEQLKLASHDPEAEHTREMLEKLTAEPPNGGKDPGSTDPAHEHPPVNDLIGKTPEARCGYELKVTFHPGFSVGQVREGLLVYTDIPKAAKGDDHVHEGAPVEASADPLMNIGIAFTGNRSGPIQILAAPGALWSAEHSILSLGRFPAKVGAKAKLLAFVKKSDQEMVITEATMDPPHLKYEFRKDENFVAPGRDKYEIVIEVPAGGLPLSLGGGDRAGTVTLQTNHPEAKTIKFDLHFTSF